VVCGVVTTGVTVSGALGFELPHAAADATADARTMETRKRVRARYLSIPQ
jgi:hypothetical protein